MDYLAIGHITVDRLATGVAAGGSVSYAATTAKRLGLKAGILTSAGQELDWPVLLPGIEIVRSPSSASTSFENLYTSKGRHQKLLALADPVPSISLPEAWKSSRIVHLAPVTHEVDGRFPKLFPRALIGLTPQGLLRRWDTDGVIQQGPWAWDQALISGCRVVVLSEDDLGADSSFLTRCREQAPVVLLTRGAGGATLFEGEAETSFPAFAVDEVDPTGAGDVFAAAFLIEYNLTGDPLHSTAFACCAASFVMERPGLVGIPDRAAVEARLAVYSRQDSGL